MKMMAYAILEGKIHQVKAEKIEIRYKRLFLYAHKRSGIPAKRQRNIQRKWKSDRERKEKSKKKYEK